MKVKALKSLDEYEDGFHVVVEEGKVYEVDDIVEPDKYPNTYYYHFVGWPKNMFCKWTDYEVVEYPITKTVSDLFEEKVKQLQNESSLH